jgi:hypothetical protein
LSELREYILTENERKILQAYVDHSVKLDGFSVLMLRLKRASQKLEQDHSLIKTALIASDRDRKGKTLG